MDTDKLKKLSQICNTVIKNEMMQDALKCNPKAIAQRLMYQLEKEAELCAKKGKRTAMISESLYEKKYIGGAFRGYHPDYSGTCCDVFRKDGYNKWSRYKLGDEVFFADILLEQIRLYIKDSNINLGINCYENLSLLYTENCLRIKIEASLCW